MVAYSGLYVTAIDFPLTSFAPSVAALITPGPPPSTISISIFATSRAILCALSKIGSPGNPTLLPKNVTALIDLWNENNGKNIGDEYDFQKAYINKYLKDGIEEDEDEEDEEKYKTIDDEESDKENKTTLIENALEFLHDNFEVNDKIADEYEPYMWKIIAQYKYNL